jgi:hypothetical protein
MRLRFLVLFVALLAIPALAADISGTWQFSVDIDGGGHGDPTFVLKVAAGKITGTYSGPLGELPVAGTVKADAATLIVKPKPQDDGTPVTVTYSAKIQSADKMSGTVVFSAGGAGKWTATRKK